MIAFALHLEIEIITSDDRDLALFTVVPVAFMRIRPLDSNCRRDSETCNQPALFTSEKISSHEKLQK
jgi:hypothetical protein